jgi:hypothetical protein
VPCPRERRPKLASDGVHLRRALLLFAIVLGLAALAASVSRPPEESDEPAPPPRAADPDRAPTLRPGTAVSKDLVDLTLHVDRRRRLRLTAGQAATLFVRTDEPGQVELPELGLGASAEPLTPARFELLVSDPGRYEVTFTPASLDEPRRAGTLLVESD